MDTTTAVTSWQYSWRGSLLTTLEKSQVELPSLKAGEVLVRVHAAALNPACPGFLKEEGSYFNAGFSSLDHSNLARSALKFFKGVIATMLLPVQVGGTPRKLVVVGKDMDQLPHICRYVEAGQIKPCTDSTFSFDEAPKAYEHLINGRVLGKVIVKVTDE